MNLNTIIQNELELALKTVINKEDFKIKYFEIINETFEYGEFNNLKEMLEVELKECKISVILFIKNIVIKQVLLFVK